MQDLPFLANYLLPPKAAQALADAAQTWSRGTDLYGHEAQQELRFHLGGMAFDDLVLEILLRLRRPPYAARIRRVPLSRADLLLLGISSAFGLVADPYRLRDTKLVQTLRPATDKPIQGKPLNESFHCDGTAWRRPNDLTCLLCMRSDGAGGGRSRLLDGDSLLECWEDDESRRCLRTNSVPWKLAEQIGGGVIRDRVLDDTDRLRWMRYTIEQGCETLNEVPSPEVKAALDSFEQAIAHSTAVLEFSLEPGDLLIVHNRRCLHARTPVEDPAGSQRLLYRTRVRREDQPEPPPLWNY